MPLLNIGEIDFEVIDIFVVYMNIFILDQGSIAAPSSDITLRQRRFFGSVPQQDGLSGFRIFGLLQSNFEDGSFLMGLSSD